MSCIANHGLHERAEPYPELLMTMLSLLAPNRDGLEDIRVQISDVLLLLDTTLITLSCKWWLKSINCPGAFDGCVSERHAYRDKG